MASEDTGLTGGLKPGFNDHVRRVHAQNTRWNRRRHLASANSLAETIRLRIPKVASQAEANENGTVLIGRAHDRLNSYSEWAAGSERCAKQSRETGSGKVLYFFRYLRVIKT